MIANVKPLYKRWSLLLLLTPLLAPLIITIVKNKPAPPPSYKVTIHLSSLSMDRERVPSKLEALSPSLQSYKAASSL
jgi:hypothetical protein